jgi:hypothetical protein
VNCNRNAGPRPYLVARTQTNTFRYRICAKSMEDLSTGLTDRKAAERLLTLAFGAHRREDALPPIERAAALAPDATLGRDWNR